MAVSEAQRKASDKWLKANCEYFKLRMRKGDKDKIKHYANAEGKSINQYILGRILKEAGMIQAIIKLYDHLGLDTNSLFDDYDHDYLTVNECRNGRDVLWYIDESKSGAIYVDTLEMLSEEEIEEELC